MMLKERPIPCSGRPASAISLITGDAGRRLLLQLYALFRWRAIEKIEGFSGLLGSFASASAFCAALRKMLWNLRWTSLTLAGVNSAFERRAITWSSCPRAQW
jgi:hypothetical protein